MAAKNPFAFAYEIEKTLKEFALVLTKKMTLVLIAFLEKKKLQLVLQCIAGFVTNVI